MWEPFSELARRAVVRAQEVAQMFASPFIGTEHLAFVLAENDDEVGAVLANAIERDDLRAKLGGAVGSPTHEMVFTPGAKRTIEYAFENARRLNQSFIGVAHIALGMLQSDCPPVKEGVDVRVLRAELDQIALREPGQHLMPPRVRWSQLSGPGDPPPAIRALLATLWYFPDLGPAGTRVQVTVAPPEGDERTWTWVREDPSP
jgi:hypothetical protein